MSCILKTFKIEGNIMNIYGIYVFVAKQNLY